ncbi:acyl-CoA dehydrogenase family protein [Catenulispora pinisilvae]|uniref:acyl-CoA dehydrogenase family protein n=1 Tax=Catenulispora pinisilvae TaxID=2705253 RepID=UPI00189134C2|nr:acyl-CoA dehydrogenase family protein [Catenulispora pinisilvae]
MSEALLYSEPEEELRAAVADLLADRAAWASVLARTESAEPYDTELWKTLGGGIGVAGLLVPEELGGAGASLREAAVVAEELGKAVAPVPFLGSLTATALLLAARESGNGTAALADDLLRRIAAGEQTAAVAIPFSRSPDTTYRGRVSVTPWPPREDPHEARLTGRVTSVADALPADVLLVPADGSIYVVRAADAQRTPVTTLDMTRVLCDIEFDDAPGQMLAIGYAPLAQALLSAAAVLASEQLGLAEQCLKTTVEYVKTRHQFGRAVGSYQGLKHRLAQLWVQIAQARAVARYAVSSSGDEQVIAVAVAQAHCSAVAVQAAEECVQMHGGIGFTWEHPAHLYLKRAKSASIALGSPARYRRRLAELVDLPAS